MSRFLPFCAVAFLCTVLLEGAFGAQNAKEKISNDNPLHAVWYTSSKCLSNEDKSQPGSTRENPIEVDIYDIASDHEQLDCRWIKVQGYPRSLHYYHYRDLLFPSVAAHYRLGNRLGSDRLIIENYLEGTPSHWSLQGARLELIGQFYNLCAHADRVQKEKKETWWIFGPCHYGDDYGMMLKDVSVVRHLSPPYRRITGERNRPLIGSLVDVPKDWAELNNIRDGAFAWLEAAREGRRTLEEYFFGPDAHARAAQDKDLAAALEDRDSRIAFLTMSAQSPLRKLGKSSARPRLRIFMPYEALDEQNREEWDQAAACFCVRGTCKDVWPLFEEDVRDMLDDYVCVKLWREKEEWKVN